MVLPAVPYADIYPICTDEEDDKGLDGWAWWRREVMHSDGCVEVGRMVGVERPVCLCVFYFRDSREWPEYTHRLFVCCLLHTCCEWFSWFLQHPVYLTKHKLTKHKLESVVRPAPSLYEHGRDARGRLNDSQPY